MAVEIFGRCDPAFTAVKEALRENFASGDEVAVWADGQPVVDLWAGHRDAPFAIFALHVRPATVGGPLLAKSGHSKPARFGPSPGPPHSMCVGCRAPASSIVEGRQTGSEFRFADFAHCVARELADKKDAPRHFVGRKRSAAVGDEFVLAHLRSGDDEGGHVLAADG